MTASIAASSEAYTLTAKGKLEIRLPSNNQNLDLAFKINNDGDVAAKLDKLSLSVAGGKLELEETK